MNEKKCECHVFSSGEAFFFTSAVYAPFYKRRSYIGGSLERASWPTVGLGNRGGDFDIPFGGVSIPDTYVDPYEITVPDC